MIKEDYVSFETAKLLKEKGFDCETDMYYSPEGELKCWIPNGLKSWLDNKGKETWWWKCVSPTLQMAMKWLRKEHNIDISIIPLRSHKEYLPRIESNTISHDAVPCKEYEEAAEAAIKYCLENLI